MDFRRLAANAKPVLAEVVRHRTCLDPAFDGNRQHCAGEAMDRLLSVCHSADVHHAEGVLGEAFLEFESGVRQQFSVSEMQQYVTDLSSPMKKLFGLVLCSTCYCYK